MSRADINRSGEIEVFVRVVERGTLTAAANFLDMTPSAVSKLIGRLEDRLGVRLLNRTTRKLQLTAEGAAFYKRCAHPWRDRHGGREAAAGAAPRAGCASAATCRSASTI